MYVYITMKEFMVTVQNLNLKVDLHLSAMTNHTVHAYCRSAMAKQRLNSRYLESEHC